MAIEECNERRIFRDGIEVVLRIRENSLDVSITIGPKADIPKKIKKPKEKRFLLAKYIRKGLVTLNRLHTLELI